MLRLEPVQELPYYRIKLIEVTLSTSNINRDDGRDRYVLSLPLYEPTAIAPELLPQMPDVV